MDKSLKSLMAIFLFTLFLGQTAEAMGEKRPERRGPPPREEFKDPEKAIEHFSAENTALRKKELEEQKKLHLEFINKLYDKKIANSEEIGALWKNVDLTSKDEVKALMEKVKEKMKSFRDEEREMNEDFRKNVLKDRRHEFREHMKGREKEFRKNFKKEKKESKREKKDKKSSENKE